jgi:hypothetical protein
MPIETKYLRLRTAVTLNSWFGDWQVCWLGGWAKHRMFYLVMVVRVKPGCALLLNRRGTSYRFCKEHRGRSGFGRRDHGRSSSAEE